MIPTPDTLREMAEGNKWDCKQIDEGCPEIWPELLAAADAWDVTLYEKAVAETLAEGYRQGWELDKKRLDAVVNGVLDVVDDDVWPVGTNEIRKRIIAALAGEERP